MKVVIIGAGLGGLACALACRREGIEVVVLERASDILPVGAGIQVPPNGARVCRSLGILEKIQQEATMLAQIFVRRYSNGQVLQERILGDRCVEQYGAPWFVLHRADYVKILLEEAIAAGAQIILGANVVDIDFDVPHVVVHDNETIKADVIVGADGLWSATREKLLGKSSPPMETGDLAYRATFSRAELLKLNDLHVAELCSAKSVNIWFGPEKHAVFYPVHGGQEFNLVLLRPDNIPPSARTVQADIDEMRDTFNEWDDTLKKIISCVSSALKWKLCHHEELRTWTKGSVTLLGDACHPTLPYQAQGAAMAVEDGAVLGRLLGLFNSTPTAGISVTHVLDLYERLRKSRTTTSVQGAVSNRRMYHMPDGVQQVERDAELEAADYSKPSLYRWLDPEYNRDMLGFDVVMDCEKAFETLALSASKQDLVSSPRRPDF